MNRIKKEFLDKHVLGAPESAMQVLSMWLIKKKQEGCFSKYEYER